MLVPTGTLHIAMHVRVRQLRQRHVKFGAGVAEQFKLLPVGHNDGRAMWKQHVRTS
jgi:hypothetical protein